MSMQTHMVCFVIAHDNDRATDIRSLKKMVAEVRRKYPLFLKKASAPMAQDTEKTKNKYLIIPSGPPTFQSPESIPYRLSMNTGGAADTRRRDAFHNKSTRYHSTILWHHGMFEARFQSQAQPTRQARKHKL